MTALSRFTKHSDRRANELWNVSLLPVSAANESGSFPQRQSAEWAAPAGAELRKLENLDERRSEFSEPRPLRVSRTRVGGTLL
jgi:hypothetical protein